MSTEDNSKPIMGDKLPASGTDGPPVADPVAQPPREKMIETAVKFLQNTQVRSSPLAQKKAFLQKKGLTEVEIEMAIDQSGTRQDVPAATNQTPAAPPTQGQVPMATYPGIPPQQQMVPYAQPPPPSRVTTWRDYAAVAVIVSGVSFGLYKLIMRFVAPWLKSRKEERERMERIEASVQELSQNVSQTVQALEKSVAAIGTLLEKQETQLAAVNAEIVSGKALANSRRSTDATEIKAEITSLKGLLLSRHQFPSTPQRTQIPAWQQRNSSPPTITKETNGLSPASSPTPPAQAPTQDSAAAAGDPVLESASAPVAIATKDGGEEGAPKQDSGASPDAGPSGGIDEQLQSQAASAINGTVS